MQRPTPTAHRSDPRERSRSSNAAPRPRVRGLGLVLALGVLLPLAAAPASAGGTLSLQGSSDLPIQIQDHHVEVVIQNGYARTTVTQSFFNPNDREFEAIYRVPVPEDASLSEMTMDLGELRLAGEVVERERAREVYEEEKDAGAGLAEQQETQVFDFHVSPVPPQGELSFRYVYYQPIELDTGVARFLYPLEDGGTDELAQAFWTQETEVRRSFSFHAVIESVWPIQDLRLPGLDAAAVVTQVSDQRWEVSWDAPGGVSLDRDIIVYYRLADDLPGRVEMIPYRADANGPGTFMLVVTPGIDLAPLAGGKDYTFVLDTSGSMSGKLGTLADGVARALGELDPASRFRLIGFSESAVDLTRGYVAATPDNVQQAVELLHSLSSDGGTNVYAGLKLALKDLDADRATSLFLLTDGVTNTGIVDAAAFDALMRSHDVRLFGFLLGNSSNWPLMRTITEASGGFYTSVSNMDDVLGQVLLAKSKVTHAALHDVELTIDGVHTFDTGAGLLGKVYRGDQLVIFGRYSEAGPARVELRARITGEDKLYATTVDFPAFDTEHPELERLWAKDRIDRLTLDIERGTLPEREGDRAIADLGVAYQLVTEETSMLVVRDEAFEARGIARANQGRTEVEHAAQTARAGQAPRSYRVDAQKPAFADKAPRIGGAGSGGGAFGALEAGLAGLLVGILVLRRVA